MENSLDLLIKSASIRNVSDEDEISEILDTFLSLPVTKLKPGWNKGRDSMDIIKSILDFDCPDMTVREGICILAHYKDISGFGTKVHGFTDNFIYPAYLSSEIVEEIASNQDSFDLCRFGMINFKKYLDMCAKNMDFTGGLEYKQTVYKDMSELIYKSNIRLPEDNETLGSVLTSLYKICNKRWCPGVEDIKKYEKRILRAQSTIFLLFIKSLYMGYCGKNEKDTGELDKIYEKYRTKNSDFHFTFLE